MLEGRCQEQACLRLTGESVAPVIHSDSRHFSLSLKVLFLLMFLELSEPPSAVVVYRFFNFFFLIQRFIFFNVLSNQLCLLLSVSTGI